MDKESAKSIIYLYATYQYLHQYFHVQYVCMCCVLCLWFFSALSLVHVIVFIYDMCEHMGHLPDDPFVIVFNE